MARETFTWQAEWAHISYAETSQFTETYGFAGSHGAVNLEGIRFLPEGRPSDTLLVYMHPASTLQLLPMPRAMARHGVHVLCAASRYPKNDTALIMEKVAADLGAWVRHAKEDWGYDKVVLVGWSGGGSLSLFYQSQAENPTITHTPAGDPYDLTAAGLLPADAVIFQAAHLSRAVVLTDWIDPSVRDENDPDNRDPELDLYDPDNPNRPPYSADYIARFRAAQLGRMRRKTAYVRQMLEDLKKRGGNEVERSLITHRTMAEPRFLDPALDPNDRKPGACYLGVPETVNSGPVGIGRFSTLRAWLSQWSPDDTNAHGEKCARTVGVPLLAIENSADDAVPQPHTGMIHAAAGSADKTMKVIKGATHYYLGQKDKLQEAADTCIDWLNARGFCA
ncbi:MAG: alpha/beta hydrolase [Rhodospirillaceae bacterium]|nr:alpha/beta hydrolase [Rhodospirillaceae bacterium]MYH36869.1 alpha/beta hydrolase [Rhodospirillaceae bacterium]MYK58357.1 alpha/beta hydrolase [Rhodospirillaceae bacterium]